jgi:molybdate transport system substrate-binding protein
VDGRWTKGTLLCWAVCLWTLLSGVSSRVGAAEPDSVTVFAAASTTNAVAEIGELFVDRKVGKFFASYASSSTLAKQIEQGAPADVFISANQKWMDYLEGKRVIDPSTRFDLLSNRIVLIVPADSAIGKVDLRPDFPLSTLLHDGRLAMGDPDHVPAGMYGKAALKALGVWDAVEAMVASAKDVRAALALVERGEAPLGVVYATDAAISDKVRVVALFPENTHPPILYPVAIVAGRGNPAARRFMPIQNLNTPFCKRG